ncbi:glutamine amidotransferase [Hypnocyclicus thermotrophus]|uniref:Imidazole glycerol phosphate synthase subunit HisH n=1 Tax=Hypnocyclicus thermotrophus TaxID=1627895 RepID=A0AA46DZN3_9FUSO|nr:imidazole glycerol phosphate synthase subunit HisH [Hypnocyclicus thermotrophus]TDT71462.1 glutamine amidotransferase [Hypnocyclicus thermotrophus]
MIAIIDYSVGNLHSIKSALDFLGVENIITNNEEDIRKAKALILPGVGAFRDAINSLKATGLIPVIKEEVKKGKYLLGICLGMQLLYEKSYEFGEYEGLGFLKGDICSIKEDLINKDLKVPHMGWNNLIFKQKDNLITKYIKEEDYVYFVHSYYVKSDFSEVVGYTKYNINIPAIVNNKNIFGMQFHPEKSGTVGLNLLKAYANIVLK